MKLAPIVLFVYNRKLHTKKTIEALKENFLANKSELYIFSDGSSQKKKDKKVEEIRRYLKNVKGFKKIKIFYQNKNLGLSQSITSGVSKIVNKYGKVIVLEDDIITSKYFLKFMNDALEYYKNNKKVWHISGWSYPINLKNKDDVYFLRIMNCWGWSTWKSKWKYYEKNTEKIIKNFSKKDIYKFNFDGSNKSFWRQIILNKNKKINTWAIFWYAIIFKNKGLCLHPSKSFTCNIGFDGSGTHTFDLSYKDNKNLNKKKQLNFKSLIEENLMIVSRIKHYFYNSKKNMLFRILSKIFFKIS